jgi:hypothetical protein
LALKQQLYREKKRQQRLLEGHSPPSVSATSGLDLVLRSFELEEEEQTNSNDEKQEQQDDEQDSK